MDKAKRIETIERIEKQLKIALKDLELVKQDITAVDTHVPTNLTLNDLYKAMEKYKPYYGYWLKQAMVENNISSLEELMKLRPREVRKMKKIGVTTLYYIREAMEDLGIQW